MVSGPMGSGKTAYLVRYIETHGRFSQFCLSIPSLDNRDGSSSPWSSRSFLTSSASIGNLMLFV